jgi:hypothetical protein
MFTGPENLREPEIAAMLRRATRFALDAVGVFVGA